MKKLVAIVLTLAMMMMMVGTVYADVAYDTPLTVGNLAKGDVAHFYKVIEWVGTGDGNVSGWKAISPFDQYLTKAKLEQILVGKAAVAADPDNGIAAQAEVAPTGITSEDAGEIAKLASGTGTTANVGDNGIATLENASEGMWMVLVTPYDADTIYNPMFVSADYNKTKGGTVDANGEFVDAVAKKSTITLTKTASTSPENAWDDNLWNTTAIGDTVNFTVTTKIPAYGNVYDAPHFVVKDTLTDLTLNTTSVSVTGVDAGNYTVEATASGYTITFNSEYLKTIPAAKDITITYSATVATTAAKAVNEETNDVMIEYSHNPNSQSDYKVKKDTTQHYTFSLDAEGAGQHQSVTGKKTSEVVKIGVDAQGNPITETTETSEITGTETWQGPLAGAKFGLYTDKDATVAYVPNGASEGLTATTGADGRMNFSGLDAGTYYLKEIEAPAGFVASTHIAKIEIVAEVETINVTEYYDPTDGKWYSSDATGRKAATYATEVLKKYSVKIDGEATATYTFTNADGNSNEIKWEDAGLVEKPYPFSNVKGVELPSTGGIGTTIFYILGGLLVVGAAVILIARRKAQD